MKSDTTKAMDLPSTKAVEYLYYDESSPSHLRWALDKGPRAKEDSIAGSQRNDGYWVIRLDRKLYLVHRLVWIINKGDITDPSLVINHIDNNPSNNNILNLELCTRKDNSNRAKMHTGRGLRSDNTSGINGIRESNSGQGNLYAVVYYTTEGVQRKKHFSYTKLGKDKAWEEAKLFKESL